ncbi:MAG TPA: hypothetical protein VN604_11805 [Nitrospirota bacterium]|nr:hypothetical protein [Nitrospirota bacterium]
MQNADCGMNNDDKNESSERIKTIIEERSRRYAPRGGSISLAAIEGDTVKIAPAGFCWR